MKYIIANWKMNKNVKEVLDFAKAWNQLLQDYPDITNKIENKKIIIAPSHLHIPLIAELSEMKSVHGAAQDLSEFQKGAHTGETANFQLKEFVDFAIVGHSERKESHDSVMNKTQRALENAITPIVCFTQPEQAGKYYVEGCLLAWEDPGNISKDGVFNPKDPEEIKSGIDKILGFLPEGAGLIYGGSVNEKNISDLSRISGVSGVLVGQASLNPNTFFEICISF